MKISVFGLGYVGVVSAACLARDGHRVIGVDVNPDKVARVNAGDPPIVETGLTELLQDAVRSASLTATTDAEAAIAATDLSLVSVGTPSLASGAPDLSFVRRVCEEIGEAVRAKGVVHTIVLRSTVPVGTTARLREQFAEWGLGDLVHLGFNPEFLREATAIRDYDEPPYTIIGARDPIVEAAMREMYASVRAPVHVVESGEAELLKVVANVWHATKVTFANEVGRIARACEVDGGRVMELIVKDEKLNVSAAYMRPGGPFGGSCLPKDVRGLAAVARDHTVSAPLVTSLEASNRVQAEAGVDLVLRTGRRRVAVIGLAFKSGTDDLRESPAVHLVKRLIGEGRHVSIYDPRVHEARLMGANLEFIRSHLPHFETMLCATATEALDGAELAVVTQGELTRLEETRTLANGCPVIDLSRALSTPDDPAAGQ